MLVSLSSSFLSLLIDMFNSLLCLGCSCWFYSWLYSSLYKCFIFFYTLLEIVKLLCALLLVSLFLMTYFIASKRYCFSVSIFLSYSILFLFTILFILIFYRITSRFCSALSLLYSFLISLIYSAFFCYYLSSFSFLIYSFFLRRICFPNRFYCSLCTFSINSRAFFARSI